MARAPIVRRRTQVCPPAARARRIQPLVLCRNGRQVIHIYPIALYPLRIYNAGMAGTPNSAPLTPAVLHILLALSSRERHGYGIMKQVESDSQGKVKMGPGTLYGSLARMLDAGLIRESDKRIDPKLDD